MYTSIALFYDTIFPYQETTHQFLDKHLPQGVIYDIACGTGTYALALHGKGRTVYASDIDQAMIDEAKKKNKTSMEFTVADMNQIESKRPVQGIYMIGNSLAHASSIEEIQTIIKRLYDMLDKDGTLIIQIVNYYRVVAKGITTLPLIIQNKLKFHREYYFDQHRSLIFQTILEYQKERIINHIELQVIKKQQLQKILKKTGFRQQEWFGSFDESLYNKGKSFHAIVVCQK